jgi:hypothetical protein
LCLAVCRVFVRRNMADNQCTKKVKEEATEQNGQEGAEKSVAVPEGSSTGSRGEDTMVQPLGMIMDCPVFVDTECEAMEKF